MLEHVDLIIGLLEILVGVDDLFTNNSMIHFYLKEEINTPGELKY